MVEREHGRPMPPIELIATAAIDTAPAADVHVMVTCADEPRPSLRRHISSTGTLATNGPLSAHPGPSTLRQRHARWQQIPISADARPSEID